MQTSTLFSFLLFIAFCFSQGSDKVRFPSGAAGWWRIQDETLEHNFIFIDSGSCPGAEVNIYYDSVNDEFLNSNCEVIDPRATIMGAGAPAPEQIDDVLLDSIVPLNAICQIYVFNENDCSGNPSFIECLPLCAADDNLHFCADNTHHVEELCCPDSCNFISTSSSQQTCENTGTGSTISYDFPFIDACGSVIIGYFEGCGDGVYSGEECDYILDPVNCLQNCICDNSQAIYIADGAGSCTLCGNGEFDGAFGEECDLSYGSANCEADCTCTPGYGPDPAGSGDCILCGNGVVDIGEDCDGGDNCEADCTCPPPFVADGGVGCTACGNGQFDGIGIEECDGSDGITSNCEADCTCSTGFVPDGNGACTTCGNGNYDPPEEECDGVANCDADCTCSTGFAPDGNGDCEVSSICGNGLVEGEEECDDRYCNSDCTGCASPAIEDVSKPKTCILCGNGLVEKEEACDTKNDANCNSDCASCKANYVPCSNGLCCLCGNGVIDGSEACDGPGCNSGCTGCTSGFVLSSKLCTTCGNGKIDNGEACDTDLSSNCKSDCSACADNYVLGHDGICSLCGNGVVDSGETCDGFSSGCRSDCKGCRPSFTLQGSTCTPGEDNTIERPDNVRSLVNASSHTSFGIVLLITTLFLSLFF